MQLIVGARQSGKTDTLARWAEESPGDRVIIEPDQQKADTLRHRNHNLEVHSYSQTVSFTGKGTGVKFAIDNLEEIAQKEPRLRRFFETTRVTITTPEGLQKLEKELEQLFGGQVEVCTFDPTNTSPHMSGGTMGGYQVGSSGGSGYS